MRKQNAPWEMYAPNRRLDREDKVALILLAVGLALATPPIALEVYVHLIA